MKLYHWYSDALKEIDSGSIIVLAASLEEARQKIREHVKGEEKCFKEAIERDIGFWGATHVADHILLLQGSTAKY